MPKEKEMISLFLKTYKKEDVLREDKPFGFVLGWLADEFNVPKVACYTCAERILYIMGIKE